MSKCRIRTPRNFSKLTSLVSVSSSSFAWRFSKTFGSTSSVTEALVTSMFLNCELCINLLSFGAMTYNARLSRCKSSKFPFEYGPRGGEGGVVHFRQTAERSGSPKSWHGKTHNQTILRFPLALLPLLRPPNLKLAGYQSLCETHTKNIKKWPLPQYVHNRRTALLFARLSHRHRPTQ